MSIDGTTRVAGVFGYPVAHSLSPLMHRVAYEALGLNWTYLPFEVSPDSVASAVESIRALGLVGINVTVPHKSAVIPHLDEIDADALRVGSVNTIHNSGGILRGYSTDGPGFLDSLASLGIDVKERRVLVLGAGGSARAIVYALADSGARISLSNRTAERSNELANAVNTFYPDAVTVQGWGDAGSDADLLVNTTSLGMSAHSDEMPALPPGMPHATQTVYDIIYTPAETKLLKAARAAGCKVSNGVGMLVWQGVRSISIWSGIPREKIPAQAMEEALIAELESRSRQ